MTAIAPPETLSPQQIESRRILKAAPVNLRRDLYQFIRFVQTSGITRSHRENLIPKTVARRLAKLLSYPEEAKMVEQEGCGYWSDFISRLALEMELVSFATKGVYQGYSSSEPVFPDNDISAEEKEWKAYLNKSACQKEKAILDGVLRIVRNEFFHEGTLVKLNVFDTWGCGIGPASRMQLPQIRRRLLELLSGLEAEKWHDMRDTVRWLQQLAPATILDPATRDPAQKPRPPLQDWEWANQGKTAERRTPPPALRYEDIYSNFRECDPKDLDHGYFPHNKARQLTSRSPEVFHHVEGRYFEWFLREVPYLAGFVELAYRNEDDSHGKDIVPPLEQLYAFRLTPRFFQVMNSDPVLDRVNLNVLPNYEIVIDAPSYPDRHLEVLSPYTVFLEEDGPIHRLRLDRKKVVETAAANPRAKPADQVLREFSGKPLPGNVASELESWTGHAEKLTIYEGMGLLELRGDEAHRRQILSDLGNLAQESAHGKWVVVSKPAQAFDILEGNSRVPIRIAHPELHFSSQAGTLGHCAAPAASAQRPVPARPRPVKASLHQEDLVGYRCSHPALLAALHEALQGETSLCMMAGEDLLIVSASTLPKLRAALRRLSDRFEVDG
jgi:hypothetical protein